jgi:hypothetical protein
LFSVIAIILSKHHIRCHRRFVMVWQSGAGTPITLCPHAHVAYFRTASRHTELPPPAASPPVRDY